jgi:hypothetical protein
MVLVVKGGFWRNLLIELIELIVLIEFMITEDWKIFSTKWKVQGRWWKGSPAYGARCLAFGTRFGSEVAE